MDDADLIATVVAAHTRWKAGEISTLEAAIEQLQALLTVHHIPGGNQLVEALKALNDGDATKLDLLILPGANECQGC